MLSACTTTTTPPPKPLARTAPPTDCTARVGVDRNAELPGYLLPQSDGRTHVVEFTVPRDPLERLKLNMPGDIRLRGWYVEGAGVADAQGRRTRALVIMGAGGGGQLTAIRHPADKPVVIDPATGRAAEQRFPNATTEGMGMDTWRDHLYALNRAGFDVLAYDRRGEGLSGGFSDTNTLEQSEDIFRVLEQMEQGAGMRLLTPDGRLLQGSAAGGRLLDIRELVGTAPERWELSSQPR